MGRGRGLTAAVSQDRFASVFGVERGVDERAQLERDEAEWRRRSEAGREHELALFSELIAEQSELLDEYVRAEHACLGGELPGGRARYLELREQLGEKNAEVDRARASLDAWDAMLASGPGA